MMDENEPLKKPYSPAFPIVDPEHDQLCASCPYWNKECAVSLEIQRVRNGRAILICAMMVRDSINRRKEKKKKEFKKG